MKSNNNELDAGESKPLLSVEERTAVEKNRRRKAAQPSVRLNAAFTETNALQIAIEHADKDAALMLAAEAFGTADDDFLDGFIAQLARTNSRNGKIDKIAFNLMVSVIKGIKPQDQLESMLAAQMAAVHQVTMTLAARLNRAERTDPQDIAAFNRPIVGHCSCHALSRVFALRNTRTGSASDRPYPTSAHTVAK